MVWWLWWRWCFWGMVGWWCYDGCVFVVVVGDGVGGGGGVMRV